MGRIAKSRATARPPMADAPKIPRALRRSARRASAILDALDVPDGPQVADAAPAVVGTEVQVRLKEAAETRGQGQRHQEACCRRRIEGDEQQAQRHGRSDPEHAAGPPAPDLGRTDVAGAGSVGGGVVYVLDHSRSVPDVYGLCNLRTPTREGYGCDALTGAGAPRTRRQASHPGRASSQRSPSIVSADVMHHMQVAPMTKGSRNVR